MSCSHLLVHFMTSLTLALRLFIYLWLVSLTLTDSYCPLSFRFSHSLIVTVSPMENKRDASVAGLGWPSTPNRGSPVTHPGASTVEAPAHTTSTPSASLEAGATPTDPDTSTPMDTYSAPPQPAVPFPDTRWLNLHGSSSRAFHITSGSSDSLQDFHSLQQYQGVIHRRSSSLRNLQMS